MSKSVENITRLYAENMGFFVSSLHVSASSHHVDITVDHPQAVTVEKCADLSRAIRDELDKSGLNYSVTVSSYGAFEPFRQVFQFKKNIGREITAKLSGGIALSGILVNAGEEEYLLEIKERVPKIKGKGKTDKITHKKITYKETEYAQVKPKF